MNFGTPEALEHLLAEPDPMTPQWIVALYARVLVASTGPVMPMTVQYLSENPEEATEEISHLERMIERTRVCGWPGVVANAQEDNVRKETWPALDALRDLNIGAGSPAPALVFVGDKQAASHLPEYPFFSRSGVWLFRAIRELGIDEMTVYLTNARSAENKVRRTEMQCLYDILAPHEPTWVALGNKAGRVLRGAKIPHIETRHPQWHRRFKFDEGPEGFAKILQEDGVPGGFGGFAIVKSNGEKVDLPLATSLGLPMSVAYKRGSTDEASKAGPKAMTGPAFEKYERARRAYVLGEVKTLGEAAELVGADYSHTCKVARDDGWEIEREKHRDETREKVFREASRQEAQAIGDARKLAWTGAVDALDEVVRRMDKRKVIEAKIIVARQEEGVDVSDLKDELKLLKPMSPFDAEALTRVAIALTELGDPGDVGEKEKLATLPIPELLNVLKGRLEEQFGKD